MTPRFRMYIFCRHTFRLRKGIGGRGEGREGWLSIDVITQLLGTRGHLVCPQRLSPQECLGRKTSPSLRGGREEFAWVHSERLGASIIRVAPHKYVTMNARHDDVMPPARGLLQLGRLAVGLHSYEIRY